MHLHPTLREEAERLPGIGAFPGAKDLYFHGFPPLPAPGKVTGIGCASLGGACISRPVAHLENIMFRASVVAAVLAAGVSVPLFGQGWVDIERRPGVVLPVTSIV